MKTPDEAQATPDERPTTVGIRMGVLAPTISEQLADQCLTADREDIEAWERDRAAWNWLRLRGLLTQRESDNAAKRLTKAIAAEVVPE